ncbi:inorganic phosphate transporter [Salsuginibacillus kocurii]|uniref:inorganic phosphate transporter n=1 Tax=Salsuginibacillus kocurii TaxID=427078 RepID=UPI000361C868|nr:inorganic phosphate transporter [Salsuginibacillus kocurii]
MIWILAAYVIAIFFAMNIGASGTAAAMGPAYGSGAVKTKRRAMLLVAISAFAGALAGGEVVQTIGGGIVPEANMTTQVAVIILSSACLTLFIANLMGIPLSTSEVIVGSLAGVGVAYQSLIVNNLLLIVSFWIIIPFAAFFIAFVLGHVIRWAEAKWPVLTGNGKVKKGLGILLIIAGMLEAFAAGMNNVANAVGPLVGAGLIDVQVAVIVGGVSLALGALLLSSGVLETNGTKITRLSYIQGSAVSATGGFLVIGASIFGFPVPLTQVTTSAIAGIGTADRGFQVWQQSILKRIVSVWILSPIVALVLSYTLMTVFILHDFFTFIMLVSVFIATLGTIQLTQLMKKEKRSFQDHGSGI